MTTDITVFVKFGKREHLEMLKKGRIYFPQVKTLQEDSTFFRGYPNEGASFVDPSSFSIITYDKGVARENHIPTPCCIRKSVVGDEDVHIFSAVH